MRAQIIRLGPGECPDIETSARYFSALAFPGRDESKMRADATAAWVASYLHEANRIDESNAPFEDHRLNTFVGLDPRWCQARLRTTQRRLRDRCVLARALRPWVRDLLDDQHPPVPGIRKFTQRQIARWLTRNDPGDESETDEELRADNFQKRVWRPGRPVMHLAIASDRLLCSLGSEQTDFLLDLASVNLIRELVEQGRQVATLIVNEDRFKISADSLVQLEWVE